MLDKVDSAIICGGMAFTFLKAVEGVAIGNSLFDEAGSKIAQTLVDKAKAKGVKLYFPSDFVTADKFDANAETGYAKKGDGIPDGWMGLDCGALSNAEFRDVVLASKTILWNG